MINFRASLLKCGLPKTGRFVVLRSSNVSCLVYFKFLHCTPTINVGVFPYLPLLIDFQLDLLEKSRLVFQATDERNYHSKVTLPCLINTNHCYLVFYMLVSGTNPEERSMYH